MKIKNFFNFIFESEKLIPFQISNQFLDIIDEIESPITVSFIELREKPAELSSVDVGSEDDTAFFSTPDKVNKTEIKIGRLIRKLFGDTFSATMIEKFVNQYKSIRSGSNFKFELWGDISSGYKVKKYFDNGNRSNQLLNSCMNDESEFLSFYDDCPVKLLVLLDKEGFIWGRALLWDIGEGKKLMDRIYTIRDSDILTFRQYARQNGYYFKSVNNSGSKISYTKDGNSDWFRIKIKINITVNSANTPYPYLDTLCYAQGSYLMNYEPDGRYFVLTETDGSYEIYDDGELVEDKNDNMVYSNTQHRDISLGDAVMVRGYDFNDYIELSYLEDPRNGFIYSTIDNKWYKQNHCNYSRYHNEWIFRPNSYYLQGDWVHVDYVDDYFKCNPNLKNPFRK